MWIRGIYWSCWAQASFWFGLRHWYRRHASIGSATLGCWRRTRRGARWWRRRLSVEKRLWVKFLASVHLQSPSEICSTTTEILAAAGHTGWLQIKISENVPLDIWRTSFPIIAKQLRLLEHHELDWNLAPESSFLVNPNYWQIAKTFVLFLYKSYNT